MHPGKDGGTYSRNTGRHPCTEGRYTAGTTSLRRGHAGTAQRTPSLRRGHAGTAPRDTSLRRGHAGTARRDTSLRRGHAAHAQRDTTLRGGHAAHAQQGHLPTCSRMPLMHSRDTYRRAAGCTHAQQGHLPTRRAVSLFLILSRVSLPQSLNLPARLSLRVISHFPTLS